MGSRKQTGYRHTVELETNGRLLAGKALIGAVSDAQRFGRPRRAMRNSSTQRTGEREDREQRKSERAERRTAGITAKATVLLYDFQKTGITGSPPRPSSDGGARLATAHLLVPLGHHKDW